MAIPECKFYDIGGDKKNLPNSENQGIVDFYFDKNILSFSD
jgi:hypothetical protein